MRTKNLTVNDEIFEISIFDSSSSGVGDEVGYEINGIGCPTVGYRSTEEALRGARKDIEKYLENKGDEE